MRRIYQPAFGLAELLVVIAIVALVLAVLLPTLRVARAAGDRTTCAASLRQLFFAQQFYAADNRGELAGVESAADDRWQRRISRYLTRDALDHTSASSPTAQPSPSSAARRLLKCPSARESVDVVQPSHYGINSWVMLPAWSARRDARIPDPSRIILLGDKSAQADDFLTTEDGWFLLHPTPDAGFLFRSVGHSSQSTYRHGPVAGRGVANMAMADGHVRAFAPGELARTSGHWYWLDHSQIPQYQIDQGACCP